MAENLCATLLKPSLVGEKAGGVRVEEISEHDKLESRRHKGDYNHTLNSGVKNTVKTKRVAFHMQVCSSSDVG